MTLPNFLVIGAQRSGTSLVHRILQAHPEVFVPWRRKEIHYFDRYFDRGVDWYEGYFPPPASASQYRAIGEVTPDYLATPEVPARIHTVLPDVRLVAILRNPVERAYSWYNLSRRNRDERRDFEAFLRADRTALSYGLYHQHLRRYLEHFPRPRMLVLIYEELTRSPGEALAQLADFLDLSVGWPDPSELLEQRVNTGEAPRLRRGFALARRAGAVLTSHDLNWPVRVVKRLGVRRWFGRGAASTPMSPETRAHLEVFFEDDIRELGALLEHDLQVWRADSRAAAEPHVRTP